VARRAARFIARTATLATLACGCARRPPPGPNEAYRDPRVSAEVWNHYFEDPGRGEIYQQRGLILKLAAVRRGTTVADVGAGTGLFSMMLSTAVGPDGRVYAEEVQERFSRYIAERAAREGRDNVVSVVGTEMGIGLPAASIDLAFLCDVYHHFDHPAEMLASVRAALRPGGELFLADFKREPGHSPGWVLEHVRADEDTVKREIGQAGFTVIDTPAAPELHDSYTLRFRRR
jgi:predicted methyltransferase